MNQKKQRDKILKAACCIFATMLFWTVGCSAPSQSSSTTAHGPESVWNDMKTRLAAGDIEGAVSCFSIASQDKYQQAFHSLSKAELTSYVGGLGHIKPTSVESDRAQYYFENVVDGQKITFPIEFDKENGEWKILEF